MRNKFSRLSKAKFLLGFVLSILVAVPAFALNPDQAKVAQITGDAQYKKAGTSDWIKLETDMVLTQGDSIKTADESEVVMELTGAAKTAEIVVRKNSEFIFKTFQHDPELKEDTTLLDVSLGAVLVRAEKLVGASKFEVKTPTSIVGIRGTTFEVRVAG